LCPVLGGAYFSIAVLYDNMGKLVKGLEYYCRFLEVCQAINDVLGLGLAYNCLGVNCMYLACPVESGGWEIIGDAQSGFGSAVYPFPYSTAM